ncbi:hypothetical protein JUJ52_02590 [Virgibacillus sp. AGTR]|uniref:hypothetical protein n=1 Tax=Virgibacillus sp. AGTR TaxID=2812055 RepID=UPI001D1670AB|nr:hypothetical protein [Virgibacillus sp. AGTR]MCC2248847.1 hypothetical protein [Virgibacillus sp. AGTR]
MNFDTKHILRWGIPGWYFILNLTIAVSAIVGYEWMVNGQFIVPTIIITLMGVPLGYILHQPYFFISNIFANNTTVKWNLYLVNEDKDRRDFLSQRYAYLLTVIHGYGSLLSSIFISIISVFIISTINGTMDTEIRWLLVINLVLSIFVFTNFMYYQKSFSKFIRSILYK